MEYFSKELKDPVVVNKILMGLKIPANCRNVRVPMLHKAAAKNRKIIPHHKRANKRLSDVTTSAVPEITVQLISHRMKIDHLNSGRLLVTLLILIPS